MRFRAVFGDNQSLKFKSLKKKKKKKKEKDVYSALSQEIKCICSPCISSWASLGEREQLGSGWPRHSP